MFMNASPDKLSSLKGQIQVEIMADIANGWAKSAYFCATCGLLVVWAGLAKKNSANQPD